MLFERPLTDDSVLVGSEVACKVGLRFQQFHLGGLLLFVAPSDSIKNYRKTEDFKAGRDTLPHEGKLQGIQDIFAEAFGAVI